ncbi:MAG: AI-2E family transporter [Proteobacteria bacterium]|nr:AI-2E family transporter [Pseudomonadota bacterium]
MSDSNLGSSARVILITAAFVVVVAGIKASVDLMVPFLLSVFIATIALSPTVWLENRGVPGALAISIVMVGILIALVGLGALVVQSGGAFTEKVPFYQERLTTLMNDSIALLARYNIPIPGDLVSLINPGTALTMAGSTLRGLGNALSNGLLILLTVIFILGEAASFPKKLRHILNEPDGQLPHFSQFAVNMNRYIVLKTSVSVVTGVVVSLYLMFLGVDFPILWGLLAFLLNFVPTIGSIIAAVPAVLVALIQLGPLTALFTVIGYLAVNLIMGNAVEPRFMGRGLGLSTLVVFLSLVFWGWVLGPVGMILSVPLTMTAKLAFEAHPDTLWLAILLGPPIEEPEVPQDEAAQ